MTAFSTVTVRKVSLVLAFAASFSAAFVEPRALPSAPKRSRCAQPTRSASAARKSRYFEDHRLHDPAARQSSSGCRTVLDRDLAAQSRKVAAQ